LARVFGRKIGPPPERHIRCLSAERQTADRESERLQIMLSPEELKALDDGRFKSRMPMQAAAARENLQLGLAPADSVMGSSVLSRRSRVSIHF